MKYNKKNMENFSLENILKTSKNNRGCGNISSHNSYLCTSSNPEHGFKFCSIFDFDSVIQDLNQWEVVKLSAFL